MLLFGRNEGRRSSPAEQEKNKMKIQLGKKIKTEEGER